MKNLCKLIATAEDNTLQSVYHLRTLDRVKVGRTIREELQR